MKLHIIDEAERCLKCKKPLCQQGCPIHTPIPQITQLLLENRLMEAGEILFANNPMSAVCSTVCNHENQCEGHCVLGRKSSPSAENREKRKESSGDRFRTGRNYSCYQACISRL